MLKIIITLNLLFISLYGYNGNEESYMKQCLDYKNLGYHKAIEGCKKATKILQSKNKLSYNEQFLLGKSLDLTSAWYSSLNQHKKAFEYAMKAYNAKYCETDEFCGIGVTLGYAYEFGKGVQTNKIKAYQFYLMAAKKGGVTAQNNLDILCKKSPWACK